MTRMRGVRAMKHGEHMPKKHGTKHPMPKHPKGK